MWAGVLWSADYGRENDSCQLWETKTRHWAVGPCWTFVPCWGGRSCVPVLPTPHPRALRQPRRWSSRQGPSGILCFADELAVAGSMPCMVNAVHSLKELPLADFLCSLPVQLVPPICAADFFLLFYFACFIKIVVHWDKSQLQTVGCLAAECNSLAPFWEDLAAGNEGLQRLRPTKYMASLEKWPSTGRGAEWGAVEEAAGFSLLFRATGSAPVHKALWCEQRMSAPTGCSYCWSVLLYQPAPGIRLVLKRVWDGFLPGLIIILIVISFSYQISIIPSFVETCECVIWVTHYQIALVSDLLADWYW